MTGFIETVDGHYIAFGRQSSEGTTSYSPSIIKLSSDGTTIWSKTFPELEQSSLTTATRLEDDSLLFFGWLREKHKPSGAYTLKLRPDGNTVLTTKTMTPPSFSMDTESSTTLANGNVLVTGGVVIEPNSFDTTFTLLDTNGDLLSARRYGRNSDRNVFYDTSKVRVSRNGYPFLFGSDKNTGLFSIKIGESELSGCSNTSHFKLLKKISYLQLPNITRRWKYS